MVDCALALRLRNIAIECTRCETARRQFLCNLDGGNPRAHEDDHAVECLGFENASKCVELMHAADWPETLADEIGCRRLHLNRDLGRIGQVGRCDASHLSRHRGREKRDLPCLRRLFENPFDIVDEAHPQHLVGFV